MAAGHPIPEEWTIKERWLLLAVLLLCVSFQALPDIRTDSPQEASRVSEGGTRRLRRISIP